MKLSSFVYPLNLIIKLRNRRVIIRLCAFKNPRGLVDTVVRFKIAMVCGFSYEFKNGCLKLYTPKITAVVALKLYNRVVAVVVKNVRFYYGCDILYYHSTE